MLPIIKIKTKKSMIVFRSESGIITGTFL